MKLTGFVQTGKVEFTKVVSGVKYDLRQLMTTVTRLTKTIGDYKRFEDSDSLEIISELRKLRKRAIDKIRNYFGIRWKIKNGRSFFYGA